jgi:glucoamylase
MAFTRCSPRIWAIDGWQDLTRHGRMEWSYERAESGNVALTGEIDLVASAGGFVLALGFGRTFAEAAHRASSSLEDGFSGAASEYCRAWEDWQRTLRPLEGSSPGRRDLYRVSTAVLRTHESKRFPGGIIASLSIPWGASKGDGDLGGYHLVWPRDLVESAGALLAAGAHEDAGRVLRYLAVTQEADGHWPQNMWLDGTPYWNGVQMDETGSPILLVDLAKREGILDGNEVGQLWPMVRRAAGFLVRNGPVTQQDRWEEDPGYSPFTLAIEVAALLCAADFAEIHEPSLAVGQSNPFDALSTAKSPGSVRHPVTPRQLHAVNTQFHLENMASSTFSANGWHGRRLPRTCSRYPRIRTRLPHRRPF